MDIAKIHIEYAHKSGFSSTTCNGSCHTKVLPYLSVVQAVEGSYDIQLDNGKTYNTGNGGFFIAPANVQQRIVHNVKKWFAVGFLLKSKSTIFIALMKNSVFQPFCRKI